MRTVHETEALRPSDPVPKHHSSNPQNKSQRLRLTFKFSSNSGKEDDALSAGAKHRNESPVSPVMPTPADVEYEKDNATFTRCAETGEWIAHFPPDVAFSDDELALHPKQMYQLMKQQLKWSLEDSEDLTRELTLLERVRRDEWTAKEVVLADLIEREKLKVPDPDPELEDAALAAGLEDGEGNNGEGGHDEASSALPPLPYANLELAMSVDEEREAEG
jgi:ATP-dependent exoDNAse (exonuclease V) beta subunit